LSFEDLVTFADCFYLPYQEGPEADALAQAIARCLSSPRRPDDPESLAVRARMLRLKDFCARLVDLKDRGLFHAFHRPKTYRGGFVVRLQSFLKPQPDGSMEWNSMNPGPESAV
jgi:hypothetical protein